MPGEECSEVVTAPVAKEGRVGGRAGRLIGKGCPWAC